MAAPAPAQKGRLWLRNPAIRYTNNDSVVVVVLVRTYLTMILSAIRYTY